MAKIFLTGVTGLVGSAFVVALLREREDMEIVCMVRPDYTGATLPRVAETLREQCEFDGCLDDFERIMKRVKVVGGDVTSMVPQELVLLPEMQGVDTVFHCAADVNLGKDPSGTTYRINYNGTERMIELAKLVNSKTFHYVSTAYVAGKLVGRAMENVPQDCGFNNPYEESKCKAELLVRNCGIPFTIYRPSIITGRLKDGRIRKPLAFYRILEFIAKMKKHQCGKHGQDPAGFYHLELNFHVKPSEHVYFVPIDYVQSAITKLFQQPVKNTTYHVTGNSPISTRNIDEAISQFLRLTGIKVAADDSAPVNTDERLSTRFLSDLFPYFSSDIVFDQTNVVEALGEDFIDWKFDLTGMYAMIRSFYADFFPNVAWLQELIRRNDEDFAKLQKD